ncbi:hypothetical protein [Ottowia sp.]|uniref:hypothetical protein n=1 Tax=Ottowia sp. TaxID=1898956 RepID=UPI003A856C97
MSRLRPQGLNQSRTVCGHGCPDTTKRFARTADEAFKTPAWRNPIDIPERPSVTWHEVATWVLVVLLALLAVAVQAGA